MAKKSTLFQDVLRTGKSKGFTMGTKDASKWFRSQAQKLTKVTAKDLLDNAGAFKKFQTLKDMSVGKMYTFAYDPKYKYQLPYYDEFPLIFPIEYYGDSMLGINLHYLPPTLRAQLMDALYELITDDKFTYKTRLRVSYNILNSAAKFAYFKPCVKKYLFSHVKSPFLYIAPEEWDVALLLPTQRFVGSTSSDVWADSRRKY
jgi:hypothetical protein